MKRKLEKKWVNWCKRPSKSKKKNKADEPSFPKEEPEEEFKDLTLPEEGAMCIDSNIQAAKCMVVHLLRRVR